MIRTQIYIEEELHRELLRLAAVSHEPMAKIVRGILRDGIKTRKNIDTSGRKALLAIAHIGAKSNDPYLSENIDHYLYGAPKRHE